MHGLPHIIVAAEGEGEVAHSTAHMSTMQVPVNPFGGAYEVECIGIVLGHTRGDGKHIGVEDDVLWRHANLLHKQAISPIAHLDAPFVGVGLPLLVEGHHNHSGPQ